MSAPTSERDVPSSRIHHILYEPIDAGSKADIQFLWEEYMEQDEMNFDTFKEVFIKKEFGTIFCGFMLPSELWEFSERLLRNAVEYLFPKDLYAPFHRDKPERTIQEQIFGIYLTYSLFHLQPRNYVCNIHVTVKEMQWIMNMIGDLADRDYIEASYCLYRLNLANAFTVVAFKEEYDMMKKPKAYSEYVPVKKEVVQPEGMTRIAALGNDDIMQKLNTLHYAYESLKDALGVDVNGCQEGEPNCSLPAIFDHIQSHLQKQNEQVEQDYEKALEQERIRKQQQRDRRLKALKSEENANRRITRRMAAKVQEHQEEEEEIKHLYAHEDDLQATITDIETIINKEQKRNEADGKKKAKGERGKKKKEAQEDVLLPPRSRLLSEAHSDHELDVHIKYGEEMDVEEAEMDKFLASLKKEEE